MRPHECKTYMESNIVVIFYSKYSSKCAELFEIVRDVLDFRKICVDHADIRSTILNERDKYSIRMVPSVIVFMSTGVMQKYEDNKAFEWAINMRRSIHQSMMPLAPAPVIQPIQPIQPMQVLQQPTTLKESPMPTSPPRIVEETAPEDLMGMKRRIETSPLIQRPSAMTNTEQDSPGEENNHNPRGVKGIHDKKHDSLKNLAQQLQAEREKEDAEIAPNAISKISPQPVS
uniref:Thioredoxin domain-containing protein n=1 Tax=viral metagenome TaxID=1070528 RepID=A0A6C0K6W5_9ZZZZ